MRNIARASENDRRALFHNTAMRFGLSDAIAEKDFWVCWTLDYLFNRSPWQNDIAFKGGTSLSKCFGLIQRFSEDIDLILNWQILGFGINEPWEQRTLSGQDKFTHKMNETTSCFLRDTFIPVLLDDFSSELNSHFSLRVYPNPQTVCFDYPKCFSPHYVLSAIRLEIGTLAAWTPAVFRPVMPYAAQVYPKLFTVPQTQVLSVSAERTFWEKVTILHKEAFRVNGKLPERYSRHYYDVHRMISAGIDKSAFSNLDLLNHVVEFKSRFYRSNSARYDLARPGTMRLKPSEKFLPLLKRDYFRMGDMLFGAKPDFDTVIHSINTLESEINNLV